MRCSLRDSFACSPLQQRLGPSSILPGHLKPGGHNPFDVLHDFTSEGLHSKTEEECLQIFDQVRLVFEYLFRHLTVGTEDAKLYAKSLTALASRNPTEKPG